MQAFFTKHGDRPTLERLPRKNTAARASIDKQAARKIAAKAKKPKPAAAVASVKNRAASVTDWTSAEDAKLRKLVERHGAGSWSTKVEQLGATRSENSVRSRWHMYLKPNAPFATTPRQNGLSTAGLGNFKKTAFCKKKTAAMPPPAKKPAAAKAPKARSSAASGASSGVLISPRASKDANDGEEELKAASAVALDVSASPCSAAPLAKEWTSLPKKVRDQYVANMLPEMAEPMGETTVTQAAATGGKKRKAIGTVYMVQRSDTAPLPPVPPPTEESAAAARASPAATAAAHE